MKAAWWSGLGVGLILAGFLMALLPKPGVRIVPGPVRYRERQIRRVVVRREIIMGLPSGLSADQIAALLLYAGVIRNREEFLAQAGPAVTRFQAGVYRFRPDEPVGHVIAKLESGGP